jgi:poly-D-alanine transfer protein DltD
MLYFTENEELRSQLERLYDTSPEFGDGQDAMSNLNKIYAVYQFIPLNLTPKL